MDKMKVQILMSTYNGERFLREQIESLLRQSWKNVEILIRDDGSKDGTREILNEYSDKYENIQVYLESNLGVAGSFFELLKKSDADYVAFCDQDDIWLEKKIEAAVVKLEQEKGPALYCSNKILVDSTGNPMKKQDIRKRRPGFGNAVVECICTGCTAVMNQELAEILKEKVPEHAILHDWWTYLAASYVGKVIYDEQAYIYYRQHQENVVGAKPGFWGEVQSKAAYLRNNRGKLKGQLTDFAKLYQGNKDKDALVQNVLGAEHFPGTIKILWNRDMYRQSLLDEIIMRMLFLFHRML
ncbi:MAG: glycosyltransferase family 2 protein [Lachnospiraceae bacterium]|nr:glycosyltransferase family 2 protein [Lachnospiraceae bacterium]